MNKPLSGGSAVVLGAGIAGLLATRVLADYFDRVTLIERDRLDGVEQRRGVPQGRHLHGLMEQGRRLIEELLPGLTAEAVGRGAPVTEVLVGSRWYLSGQRARPTPTGLTTLLASRPLLEGLIRERVLALPGVELRAETMAVGLTGSAFGVKGVRVRSGVRLSVLPADLVVDATGRGSHTPTWLADLGAAKPPEEKVDVDLGYATRLYRREPGQLDGDLAVVVSTMAGRRGGGVVAQEDDRWRVTLGGMLGDHPPVDPVGFEAFAATLPVPDVHRLIVEAVPVDDPTPYRFSRSMRRHYGRSSPVAGFLAIGDAACSVNPLYAQGMTLAAQQVIALRDCLAEGGVDERLPSRVYLRAAGPIGVGWRMSTTSDLNHPEVRGRRTPVTRLTQAYLRRAHHAASSDPVVSRAFLRLANLVEPPSTLLGPRMMARVLFAAGGSAS